jgi:hypothetical protein
MKYYKIIIGGRGSEVYPFKLTEEQFDIFYNEGVEEDKIGYDDVCELLGVESYFDCPEETIMGVYPEALYLTVENENGEILHQVQEVDYDNVAYSDNHCEDDYYLFIEDYCKGDHIVYDISLEEDFDIDKLKLSLTNIGDMIELVTGITYNGDGLLNYKGYGDTSSKGYHYHLK